MDWDQISDVEFFALITRHVSNHDGAQIVDRHGSGDGWEWWDTIFQVMGNPIVVARQMKERKGILPAHVTYWDAR